MANYQTSCCGPSQSLVRSKLGILKHGINQRGKPARLAVLDGIHQRLAAEAWIAVGCLDWKPRQLFARPAWLPTTATASLKRTPAVTDLLDSSSTISSDAATRYMHRFRAHRGSTYGPPRQIVPVIHLILSRESQNSQLWQTSGGCAHGALSQYYTMLDLGSTVAGARCSATCLLKGRTLQGQQACDWPASNSG
jgi:hypothetical protein